MPNPHTIEISDRVTLFTRGRSRTYVARYWQGGQTRKVSMKTANQAVAKAKALKLAASLSDGEMITPAKRSEKTPLDQLVARFVEAKRRIERRKPKTLAKYTGVLTEFAEWHTKRGLPHAEEMSSKLFRAFESEYAGSHEPKTTHCAMTIIKQFGTWLGPRGQCLLEHNPYEAIRLPEPRSRPKFFPDLRQIHGIIGLANGQRKVQLMTLAYTGMRVDEMIHLRPQDVDFDSGFISVMARGEWTPKTHHGRKVPIHDDLKVELARLSRTKRPFFFTGEPDRATGRACEKVNDRTLLLYMQKLAESLSIPTKRANCGIVVHSFRDFFETTCVDSGVPQFVVDIWMGHSGGRTQGQTYYGLREEKSKAWMTRVDFGTEPKPSQVGGGEPSPDANL